MQFCETIYVKSAECEMPLTPPGGIARHVKQLVYRCPAMRSIWTIGERADRDVVDSPRPSGWDLVAFADIATLHYLRKAADLHRADVLLRVVTDGDRFEIAWGALEKSGSLFGWGWCRASETEAYYSEARWAWPAEDGSVERTRRRAACVWNARRSNVRQRTDGGRSAQ